jgi:hypothetical protein
MSHTFVRVSHSYLEKFLEDNPNAVESVRSDELGYSMVSIPTNAGGVS